MKSSDTGGAFRNITRGANVRLQTAIPHIDLKRIRRNFKKDRYENMSMRYTEICFCSLFFISKIFIFFLFLLKTQIAGTR